MDDTHHLVDFITIPCLQELATSYYKLIEIIDDNIFTFHDGQLEHIVQLLQTVDDKATSFTQTVTALIHIDDILRHVLSLIQPVTVHTPTRPGQIPVDHRHIPLPSPPPTPSSNNNVAVLPNTLVLPPPKQQIECVITTYPASLHTLQVTAVARTLTVTPTPGEVLQHQLNLDPIHLHSTLDTYDSTPVQTHIFLSDIAMLESKLHPAPNFNAPELCPYSRLNERLENYRKISESQLELIRNAV